MTTRRPKIAAFLGTQALGDYVMQHLVAASMARALAARLTVIFRDDRPYKNTLNRLNPFVTEVIEAPDESRDLLPLDIVAEGAAPPDILLTPSMMDLGRCIGPPPVLRLPDDLALSAGADLAAHGLDPDRWFVCLHIREPNYVWRLGADRHRDADPQSYLPLIRYLIEDQGGQVVRIGDPSMTPLPAQSGLIEVGRQSDSFAAQAYAISRSRFFVGSDSGPTQLACALNTPAASTNALGVGVWNPGDVVQFKTYRRRDTGAAVPTSEIVEMNPVLGNTRPAGLDYDAALPEDLIRVAEHMVNVTRADRRPTPPGPARDSLEFPLAWRDMTDFAEITVIE